MYVCNCNGLSRRAVDGAIADGAGTTAAVFRRLECAPQCGKCVGEVHALVASCRRDRTSHQAAPARCGDCQSQPFEPQPFLMAAE
ncbi:(2Fe-2S)-binding protein [Oleomonas cavernae]|uniref:(2Fe-2S)-binding protein n=1 Tax=Oleomonas cavernae TaxID=2320859 RepID=A0A418WC27_9PROT|nr:(2Fe-2S)-binding protein [Oleomonas cavernae]RJF87560.1 (2Fe-2S)-binding protein [Oleomonas cavernae]